MSHYRPNVVLCEPSRRDFPLARSTPLHNNSNDNSDNIYDDDNNNNNNNCAIVRQRPIYK